MQQHQAALEAAYPGSLSILSKDDSGSTYVVLSDGPQNPPTLSLYTPANHQTRIVGESLIRHSNHRIWVKRSPIPMRRGTGSRSMPI